MSRTISKIHVEGTVNSTFTETELKEYIEHKLKEAGLCNINVQIFKTPDISKIEIDLPYIPEAFTVEDMIDYHNFIKRHENQYLKMGEYLEQFIKEKEKNARL